MVRAPKRYHDGAAPVKESAFFSTGLALGNLLLQTTREGLIAHPIAGYKPVLVSSGMNGMEELRRFPYAPSWVLEGVGDIPEGA